MKARTLARRQMPRRIERIEREGLALPVRQQADQFALLDQIGDADPLDPRDADSGETGAEQGADLRDQQPARDGDVLAAPPLRYDQSLKVSPVSVFFIRMQSCRPSSAGARGMPRRFT